MKSIIKHACLLIAILAMQKIQAQLCTNNTDTLYGLNSITSGGSGQIVGINKNNAGSATVGSPAASSANANGLGYSTLDGKFYFFNQSGSGTTEFISYNPITGTKVSLAVPSSPAIPTGQKIRSGAVSNNGLGYYTVYPGATTAQGYATTNPAFYYYSIGGNTWTLLTQSFKDASGNTVAEIKNLNSGDMAFDGSGNLWMLVSNSANYALYRIRAPLPTTAVASVTVDTILSSRATPGGVSFTGIAFNSVGDLFLSTGSYSVTPTAGNNQLYRMVTPSTPLTNIGTLTNGYGDDLTSCALPLGVLSGNYIQLQVKTISNAINVQWNVGDESLISRYELEYSTDGINWNKIYSTSKAEGYYSYKHVGFKSGYDFYRVKEVLVSGNAVYSEVQKVYLPLVKSITVGPNPVHDLLQVSTDGYSDLRSYKILNQTGQTIKSGRLQEGSTQINCSSLTKGLYFVQIINTEGLSIGSYKIVKL
jgi:hypothetical protein